MVRDLHADAARRAPRRPAEPSRERRAAPADRRADAGGPGAQGRQAEARQAEAAAQQAPREAALAMGMLAWVMMGLAIWHFTIFLPDRFWGGIVGAFLGALIGAVVFGLIVNGGFTDPGRATTRTC